MALTLLLAIACADDPCAAMCAAAVPAYTACLADWDASWSDAGYADADDFRDACSTWAWEQRLLERETGDRGGTDATCAARATALRQDPRCDTYASWDWSAAVVAP